MWRQKSKLNWKVTQVIQCRLASHSAPFHNFATYTCTILVNICSDLTCSVWKTLTSKLKFFIVGFNVEEVGLN